MLSCSHLEIFSSPEEPMTHNVKACRERAGFQSPQQAALALKIDPSQYRKIESGERGLNAQTAVRLARGFGCSTDELLGLRDVSA